MGIQAFAPFIPLKAKLFFLLVSRKLVNRGTDLDRILDQGIQSKIH